MYETGDTIECRTTVTTARVEVALGGAGGDAGGAVTDEYLLVEISHLKLCLSIILSMQTCVTIGNDQSDMQECKTNQLQEWEVLG